MKIAFTAIAKDWDSKIDSRFGRASNILIFDESTNNLSAIDNSQNSEIAHGAGPKTAKVLIENNVDILVISNELGEKADLLIKKHSIKTFKVPENLTIKQAYEALKNSNK
jgi:predicted Fe-Mo cluster-binding NifX family protein